MVLEESLLYSALFVSTLVFSVVALLNTEYRLLLKVVAGLCWFVMALSQFYFFGVASALSIPVMFLFLGFGLIYCFSIVSDFKQAERDRVYGFMDD